MSNLALADAIRASIKQYKQLSDFADQLEALGSIEQAVSEKKAEHEKVTALVQGLKAEYAGFKAKLADAEKQKTLKEQAAIEIINSAETMAKKIAEEIKQQAREQASVIIEKAKAKHEELEAKANLMAEQAQASLNMAAEEVEKANQSLIEKRSELQAIQAEIETLKANASRLFGN